LLLLFVLRLQVGKLFLNFDLLAFKFDELVPLLVAFLLAAGEPMPQLIFGFLESADLVNEIPLIDFVIFLGFLVLHEHLIFPIDLFLLHFHLVDFLHYSFLVVVHLEHFPLHQFGVSFMFG
jgi:hypothetical protein